MTIIDVSKYSTIGALSFLLIKNEDDSNKELLGTRFCSTCDPFSCSCNIDDSEACDAVTIASFMGQE